MSHLTAEQIAERAESKDGLANIREINRLYRLQDESRLYPVCGKFDVTERAIRRVREMARHNGAMYGLEYAYCLDAEISEIVNGLA